MNAVRRVITTAKTVVMTGDAAMTKTSSPPPLYRVGGGGDGGRGADLVVMETLVDLAARVGRLSPSHRDPERYHVEKSEIVGELRRLARRIA